jgi:tetratricopeptide (TPR) repeat protein
MNIEEIRAEFGDPDRIEARLAFHRRVIAEEEAARAICDRVLTSPSRWWGNAIRQQEGGVTAGMVTALIERAEAALARSPLDALELAETAVTIAKKLDASGYPYDHVYKVRGQAFREKAYVLSFLGRLKEAAEVAERSAECLEQIPVPPPELARLALVRSDIARNMANYEEAVSHARAAGRDFLAFGDREGWLKARTYEACARYERQDYRGALEVWRSTAKYAHLLSERHRAERLHNVAMCAAAAGEFDQAAREFTLAAEAFDRLGLPVNHVKCRCSIGRALHAAGRYAEAIEVLEKVWRQYEDLGMEGDAAYAALLLAECLLLAGRRDEVAAISRMLIDRCTRAGMTASAMTALAFLRETVATGHVTPVLVQHVRDFFESTNEGSERAFAPMPRPRGDS